VTKAEWDRDSVEAKEENVRHKSLPGDFNFWPKGSFCTCVRAKYKYDRESLLASYKIPLRALPFAETRIMYDEALAGAKVTDDRGAEVEIAFVVERESERACEGREVSGTLISSVEHTRNYGEWKEEGTFSDPAHISRLRMRV